jgi:hypothetical protein
MDWIKGCAEKLGVVWVCRSGYRLKMGTEWVKNWRIGGEWEWDGGVDIDMGYNNNWRNRRGRGGK